jgi:hypothetical protein
MPELVGFSFPLSIFTVREKEYFII